MFRITTREQTGPPWLERPFSDRVAGRCEEDREVLFGPAVLGAAGVRRGEAVVLHDEALCLVPPACGCRHDVQLRASAPPEREHAIGERVPDGDRLALRLDLRSRTAGAKQGLRLPGGGARHVIGRLGGDVRSAGDEAQAARQRSDLVEQVEGSLTVPVPDEPGQHQQGGVLRQDDPVRAVVEQAIEVLKPVLGQVVGEQQVPVGREPEPLGERDLVRLQGALGERRPRREPTAQHLEGHPRREVGHRRAGAQTDASSRQCGEGAHPRRGAGVRTATGVGILVRGGRQERPTQLTQREPVHHRLLRADSTTPPTSPTWRVLPPLPPGPSPVLC